MISLQFFSNKEVCLDFTSNRSQFSNLLVSSRFNFCRIQLFFVSDFSPVSLFTPTRGCCEHAWKERVLRTDGRGKKISQHISLGTVSFGFFGSVSVPVPVIAPRCKLAKATAAATATATAATATATAKATATQRQHNGFTRMGR